MNMQLKANQPLPLWKSHKVVAADKIEDLDYDDGKGCYRLKLSCGASVMVPPGFVARGVPEAGCYYIRYKDGYESWSPADVFEEGYTPFKCKVPPELADALGYVGGPTTTDPSWSALMKEPSVSDEKLLDGYGDDAARWAEAFCNVAKKIGVENLPQDWVHGWFANAIEHSTMIRRERAGTTPEGAELLTNGDVLKAAAEALRCTDLGRALQLMVDTHFVFARVGRFEPIFTLRAQDRLSPKLVDAWAKRARKRGVRKWKVRSARKVAQAMRAWEGRRYPT